MIGERLKHQFEDNEAWVLSYREECFDQIGLKPSIKIPLYNGSLECEFRKYQIFSGKYKDMRADGGEIKTDEERRLMAEKKRFKAHREFKRALDEEDDNDTYRPRHRNNDRDGGGSWQRDRREGNRERRGGFDRDRDGYRERRGGFDRDRDGWQRNRRNDNDQEGFRHAGRPSGRPFDRGDRGAKGFGKNRKNNRYDDED